MKGICTWLLLGGMLVLFQGCLTAPGRTIQFSGVDAAADHSAKVKSIEGRAQMRASTEAVWEKLIPNNRVAAGMEVRTAAGGKVELEFSDGSVIVADPESVISVRSIESPVVGDRGALNVAIQVLQGRLGGQIQSGTGATTFQVIAPDGTPSNYTPAPGQSMSLALEAASEDQLFVFAHPDWGMHPNFSVNDWRTLTMVPLTGHYPVTMLALGLPLIIFFRTQRGRREFTELTTAKTSCQAPRFLR
jgi:hypothetical protein